MKTTNEFKRKAHKHRRKEKIRKLNTSEAPHMEWNIEDQAFEQKAPRRPPILKVTATMMNEEHKEFGVNCSQRQTQAVLSAVADTGCQTSTSGIGILKALNIPARFLIPTKHRIIGITDTSLKILGVLLLKIECNGRSTNQMVYVSSNASGSMPQMY